MNYLPAGLNQHLNWHSTACNFLSCYSSHLSSPSLCKLFYKNCTTLLRSDGNFIENVLRNWKVEENGVKIAGGIYR